MADDLVFRVSKQVDYKGRKVSLSVGEAPVTRLSDDEGRELGRWTLLTNVEDDLRAEEIAQWYYWRWNIESFFKLIKGAGHDVVSWLQRGADRA